MCLQIFLHFPEALRPSFQRLREKLDDPDPGVQAAAVNVVCELARKNPKNYLSLAPVFFKVRKRAVPARDRTATDRPACRTAYSC